MWWKIALAVLFGVALGIAAIRMYHVSITGAVQDSRIDYVRSSWSSDNQEWSEFSEWLKHGGRYLLIDGAFAAAKDGLTEEQIRTNFGAPDRVVVGADELEEKLPTANMRGLGAEGAYVYKLGIFATPPSRDIFAQEFIIVFDRTGRVVYRLGGATHATDPESDINVDTRSERRIDSSGS